MTATYAARASRQSVILAIIAGLHTGAFVLIASGLVPRLIEPEPTQEPITVHLPPPVPIPLIAPTGLEAAGFDPAPVPIPLLEIPLAPADPPLNDKTRDPMVRSNRSGLVVPVEATTPTLRSDRLAAMIDSCYPSAARRLGEEGRVVARIIIDATGQVTDWTVDRSSGFLRLDAALECVVRRLEFVPGRRDGRAVVATVMLPIVFRLD